MVSTTKLFFVLAALCAISFSALPGVTTINTPIVPLVNNSNSSNSTNGSFLDITLIQSQLLTITPAITEMLKEGPMVYAATGSSVLVIDSSTRNVVSTIKPDVDKATVNGVGVSPDGQYVYIVYSWSTYESDPYGGHYNNF